LWTAISKTLSSFSPVADHLLGAAENPVGAKTYHDLGRVTTKYWGLITDFTLRLSTVFYTCLRTLVAG
jgi:hypothetical protein